MVAKKLLSVFGLLKSVDFQRASGMIEDLSRKNYEDFEKPVSEGMLECDWVVFVESKKKDLGGEVWSFRSEVIIFEDNTLIGDFEKFVKWAEINHKYIDYRPLPLWHAMAKEKYKAHLLEKKHEFVYLDMKIASDAVGRLLIELYTDICPKTCANFKILCKGDLHAETEMHNPPLQLSYKDSIIHRIVPNGWIQGGDFITRKGTGGFSVYGSLFDDENFSVKHQKRGIVGMANKGRHTNASQFYITLQSTPWMDTKYVAFGEVIEGMDVLKLLEEQETYNERPKKECLVVDCGIFDIEKLWI